METRERILHQARELLLSRGFGGFSMRALAQGVGVTPTALYRHFADKDALLAELVDEGFSTFAKFLRRSLVGKTPLERLRRAGECYFDFAFEHPQHYKLMFLLDCRELGFRHISEEVQQRARATFGFLVERIEECRAAGEIAALADSAQLALSVWSHLHGLVALWLQGQLDGKLDAGQLRSQIGLTLDDVERSLGAPRLAR
jgi:AcrR family transcriptional regulator